MPISSFSFYLFGKRGRNLHLARGSVDRDGRKHSILLLNAQSPLNSAPAPAILIMDFQTAPMVHNVLNLRWAKP